VITMVRPEEVNLEMYGIQCHLEILDPVVLTGQRSYENVRCYDSESHIIL
jgi:hypothetical protein